MSLSMPSETPSPLASDDFAAALDIEIEVDGDAGAAGPGGIGRELAIADEIAGDHPVGTRREGVGLAHGRFASLVLPGLQAGWVRGAVQAS